MKKQLKFEGDATLWNLIHDGGHAAYALVIEETDFTTLLEPFWGEPNRIGDIPLGKLRITVERVEDEAQS